MSLYIFEYLNCMNLFKNIQTLKGSPVSEYYWDFNELDFSEVVKDMSKHAAITLS